MSDEAKRWEEAWALDLPAENAEQMLFAEVLKDLAHGASFDVEFEGDGTVLQVDFTCGDELEETICRLIVVAEVEGPEEREMLGEFAEETLGEMAETAAAAAQEAELLGKAGAAGVELRAVPEDEERWDLVAPDWLAPEDAEVPFGFRPFRKEGGEPWPSNEDLDRFSRVVLVPVEEGFELYGVNLPEETEESEG